MSGENESPLLATYVQKLYDTEEWLWLFSKIIIMATSASFLSKRSCRQKTHEHLNSRRVGVHRPETKSRRGHRPHATYKFNPFKGGIAFDPMQNSL